MSLFTIFSGTSSKRRNAEVARLNSEFEAMVNLQINLNGILHYFVETENYRMLSAQEYHWKENPIRSGRICDRKELTSVKNELNKNFTEIKTTTLNFINVNFRLQSESDVETQNEEAEVQQQQQQQQQDALPERSDQARPEAKQKSDVFFVSDDDADGDQEEQPQQQQQQQPNNQAEEQQQQQQQQQQTDSQLEDQQQQQPFSGISTDDLQEEDLSRLSAIDSEIAQVRRCLLTGNYDLDKLKKVRYCSQLSVMNVNVIFIIFFLNRAVITRPQN